MRKHESVEAHGEICETDPCTACKIGRRLSMTIFANRRGSRVEIHVSQEELATYLSWAALQAFEKAGP